MNPPWETSWGNYSGKCPWRTHLENPLKDTLRDNLRGPSLWDSNGVHTN